LGQALAHFGLCRHLPGRLETIDLRFAVDVLPDEFGEAARLLFLDVEPKLRAVDGGRDLRLRSNDALILEQALNIALSVAPNLFRLKAVKGFAKVLTLSENRDPRKP